MPKTPSEILNRRRELYQRNQKSVLARQKERYHQNKSAITARRQELYASNKKSVCARQKERYYRKQVTILARQRELRQLNKKELNAKQRCRYKNDIVFATKHRLRQRVRDALRGHGRKAVATEKLLGCTFTTLVAHLESLFTKGMTWDNMNMWHIDHKIPCAAFDLHHVEQQYICFWYLNLQPMWAEENLSKGDNWVLQDKQDLCLAYYAEKSN